MDRALGLSAGSKNRSSAMGTIQQRISLRTVFGFLVITLLASSATAAYGDVFFLGEARDTGFVENEVTSQESLAFDAFFEDEEPVDEARVTKASNPVVVLSSVIRMKLDGVGSAVDVAFRESINTTYGRQNQWPILLAGLLFLMLVMRLRRRTRKSKFS